MYLKMSLLGIILFLAGYFGADYTGYFISVILLFLGVVLFLAGFFVTHPSRIP